MSLETIIKEKYGSIDNMVLNTEIISRAYIYQLLQGVKCNPTKDILKELSRLLDLSIEKIIELIDEIKKI